LEISPISDSSHSVLSLLNKTTDYLTHHCPATTPRLDAEVLLAHVLQTDKTGLYLSLFNHVSNKQIEQLQELLSRRIKQEPVSYIVGRKEFWSLTFKVTYAVMIPRPQTETLVEAALQIFPPPSTPSILEIGTGSGAISVALATELPGASVTATDISPEALSVARENASANGVTSIKFIKGDLFNPLKKDTETYDLIVSNPPYIPSEEIPRLPAGIRDFEPHSAFDGGSDGLEYYRKIAGEAHHYLKPGGWLFLEIGYNQGQDVCHIMCGTGKFSPPKTLKDLSGNERVVKAFRV